MRILYLTGHYPPDLTSGATLQVQRLAAAARRAGHDVRVVAGAHRSGLADGAVRDEVVDDIDVRWIGTAGWTDQSLDENWWNPVAADCLARVLDSWEPDVVHAHALQTLGAGALEVVAARGVRTVVTMHDFWWVCARLFLVDRDLRPCPLVPSLGSCDCARSAGWRRERENRLREVLRRVDVVLAPSQAVCEVLAANGIDALLDPNDVEIDIDTAIDTGGDTNGDTNGDATVRFLYVGGPNPLKGSDVVRAAAASMDSIAGWHLDAYGLDHPSTRRVTSHLAFYPDRRRDVFASADVLLLPSIARESFSLVAREALAAGVPVITSDCLGPEEVVVHDRNGLVVPTGDAIALADAMARLVHDRVLLRRLREGAQATAIDRLDADGHLAALMTYYVPPVDHPRSGVRTGTRTALVRSSAGNELEAERTAATLRRDGWQIVTDSTADPSGATPADVSVDVTVTVGDVTPGAIDAGRVVVPALRTPFVRIVVVNHRARDLTLRCLEHVDTLTYPRERFEVVVVDNDSGDGLVDHLRTTRPDVRVVANAHNRGFGAGCNAGIALDGHWDAIALLNNDSTPRPDWLDALVSTWRRPPVTDGPVGAVAGKVLLAGSGLVNSAGCDLREGGFNADRGDGRPDDGSYDDACEVFGWSGASALLTRAMIDDIGTFDESLFLYYEDVDMVWRARRRGWSIAYAPGAVSDHDRGATAGRSDLFWFHDTRNRLVVLARHAPTRWLLRAVAVQLRAVVVGSAGSSRTVRVRALASLVRRAPRLVAERRRLAQRATVGRDAVTAWRDR